MSETLKTTQRSVVPSAAPSEAEIAAWNELTRDEQLSSLRAVVESPEARTDCGRTMDQIMNRLLARIAVSADA